MKEPTTYDLEQTRGLMAFAGVLLILPMVMTSAMAGVGDIPVYVPITIGLVQLFLFGPVIGVVVKGIGTGLYLMARTYIAFFKGEL